MQYETKTQNTNTAITENRHLLGTSMAVLKINVITFPIFEYFLTNAASTKRSVRLREQSNNIRQLASEEKQSVCLGLERLGTLY